MSRPRVIVADDYEPIRRAICRVLEPHYDVIAAIADGRALLTAVEQNPPDLVVVDIAMPIMNGMAAAAQLKVARPEVKILFISAHSKKIYIDAAMERGADGYLLKESVQTDLIKAIDRILRGGAYWPSGESVTP